MIVDLFIPCHVDQFRPEIARNTMKVLQRVGCGVNYNIEQTCCGQPAYEDGFRDHCKEVGEKLIKEFQDERFIVCPGPGCVKTVRDYYPALFHNSSLHNEYKLVQKHFYEFGDFLANKMNVSEIGAQHAAKVWVLNSCNCKSDTSDQALMSLLSKVKGLTITGSAADNQCCGMGGGLDRRNEELTVKMAVEMIRQAEKTGADTIVSNDPLCLLHLEGVIWKEGATMQVMHLADVLASGWE